MKKYRKAEEGGEVKNLLNDLHKQGRNSGAKSLFIIGVGRALRRVNVRTMGPIVRTASGQIARGRLRRLLGIFCATLARGAGGQDRSIALEAGAQEIP